MKACQITLAVLVAVRFLCEVYLDFNGRPSRPPLGFAGFIGTLTVFGLMGALYWGAGAFSLLLE